MLGVLGVLRVLGVIYPPQTTSLPPERREMLCFILGSGRSGMEQLKVGKLSGGGNISTALSFMSPCSICQVFFFIIMKFTRVKHRNV